MKNIHFVEDASQAPIAPGAYILWLRLDASRLVTTGVGQAILYPGDYLYCGSAYGPGGLRGRLARHMRREKRPHWHIDQLTAAGVLRGAWVKEGGDECVLNAALGALPIALERFGSSDCPRCPSHLRRLDDAASLPETMRRSIEAIGAGVAWRAYRLLHKPDPDASLMDECWVRIMSDYSCDGVWNRAGCSVELEELPVEEALRDRIRLWRAHYDAHDDTEGDMPDLEDFAEEGKAIAEAVKGRLPEWTVVYFDDAKHRRYLKARRYGKAARDFEYEISLQENPLSPDAGSSPTSD
jgi:Uri superfamily endonuclease